MAFTKFTNFDFGLDYFSLHKNSVIVETPSWKHLELDHALRRHEFYIGKHFRDRVGVGVAVYRAL